MQFMLRPRVYQTDVTVLYYTVIFIESSFTDRCGVNEPGRPCYQILSIAHISDCPHTGAKSASTVSVGGEQWVSTPRVRAVYPIDGWEHLRSSPSYVHHCLGCFVYTYNIHLIACIEF